MSRRRYTPDQRTEARQLARQAGTTEASHLLGIPAGTIREWIRNGRALAEITGRDWTFRQPGRLHTGTELLARCWGNRG